MGLKKIKQQSLKEVKFDVQSRFSEGDLEYVTEEDSYQVLQSFDSWHEYNHERNEE
jgi:hypothetical protein